jgi:CAAX prenyl protease-like protein
MTVLEGQVPLGPAGAPTAEWYAIAYAAKIAVVVALLWVCRGIFRDLRPLPSPTSAALAVVIGLGVIVAWIGLDGRYPVVSMLQGKRAEFDPHALAPGARYAFLAIRMLGLVVIVPLIEELFYRSFLMRWLVDPDLSRVPIGKVTPMGLGVTSVVFALSHPEWLPALLTGLVWGWLVGRTKSVSACVLSHATANLALGVYVLWNHAWKFW